MTALIRKMLLYRSR